MYLLKSLVLLNATTKPVYIIDMCKIYDTSNLIHLIYRTIQPVTVPFFNAITSNNF